MTNAIVATFTNFTFPTYAIIPGKRIYFNLSLQRIQRCQHCQRFGHIKQICKNIKYPCICSKYGQSGYDIKSCNAPKPNCINCIRNKKDTFDNSAKDNNCPVYMQQKEIKHTTATLCLSAKEAIKHLKKENKTRNANIKEHSGIPNPTFGDFIPNYNSTFAKATKFHFEKAMIGKDKNKFLKNFFFTSPKKKT